jgi:hypothetical protein
MNFKDFKKLGYTKLDIYNCTKAIINLYEPTQAPYYLLDFYNGKWTKEEFNEELRVQLFLRR